MHRLLVQVCMFVASCAALLPPAGAQDGREHSIGAFCMEWGPKQIGGKKSVVFRSYNFPERVIRHRNYELWLDPVESSPLFKHDSSFLIEAVRHPPTRIDYDAGQPADD